MVVVTVARADIRQVADLNAPLVFQAERDVALELVEHGSAGWLKVRHRDGQVGFILASPAHEDRRAGCRRVGNGTCHQPRNRHEVHLWTRNPAQCAEMSEESSIGVTCRVFPFPSMQIELKLEQALDQADLALVVVPTAGFRQVVRQIAELGAKMPLLWACKGFEAGTAKLPHQVVAEELGGKAQCGALSGPSFAQEVAKGLPTALTLASRDELFAHAMALELHSPRLRVYSSPDVVGVEVGGAVKNVMAIAAGSPTAWVTVITRAPP